MDGYIRRRPVFLFNLFLFCVLSSCYIPEAFSLPVNGSVSQSYQPPPGVMPIVVLQGSPYEMGYQYGLQAGDYISVVRDSSWASALSTQAYQETIDACEVYRQYISKELPKFDFIAFFQGMSDSMNEQGVKFSSEDCIVMLYWGARQGPQPPDHCTAFAAYGNATSNSTIAGVNFDYYHLPSNSYAVVLALYPKTGYSCILPAGAGRTGSNAVMNEKGLAYLLSSAPQQGADDKGLGITGFLELPYVGMTCGSTFEAEAFLTNSTRMFGLNRLLVDGYGHAEVLEATRGRYAVRHSGDYNETDYLVAANHYLNPAMKPSQTMWDPLEYYPSSYYRYHTAEKMISENYGNVNYSTAVQVLSSTDWWDGKEWHCNDPWSTNTINRFRSDCASLYSAIAVPGNDIISICTGNPGMPYWGALAPGHTGTYVNLTVGRSPEDLVFNLRSDADKAMWSTVQVLGENPPDEAKTLWADAEDEYWEAVWWLDHAVLENNGNARAVAWGKSATLFAEAIAHAEEVLSLCRK